MQAIIADTEFLEENTIMDYSLLTCIDSSTGELVVGIIGESRCAERRHTRTVEPPIKGHSVLKTQCDKHKLCLPQMFNVFPTSD